MAKENTFWFPHDYEPTADVKMQALIGEHGAVGYGIFWRFTEMLHSEKDHKLPMKPYLFMAIAKQMQANAEQVEAVLQFAISTCELFESDGKFFWSARVNRNCEDRAKISHKRSLSGKKGAIAKQMLQANKQSVAQDITGQDITGHRIQGRTAIEIKNSIFGDELFMADVMRNHAGKNIERAWTECYAHFSQLPAGLMDWEWRQKLLTWLNKTEQVNGKRHSKGF